MPSTPARSLTLRTVCGIAAAALALALWEPTPARSAAASASLPADVGVYSIALQPGSGATPALLTISGTWPTPCTPTFEHASLNGADLRVDARAALSLCAGGATPFTLEVDPALALDRPALAPAVYHVSLYAANGAQSESRLRAFALVDRSKSAPAFAPESGLWWTTSKTASAANRNVFSLERQGSQLTAALMTYDANGRGVWQVGTAQLDGRTAHVALLQLAGGNDPFTTRATSPHGEPGLVLDLEFTSSSSAKAWLSRPGAGDDAALELQSLELVRLQFSGGDPGNAWRGDWILVTDADQYPPLRLRFDRLTVLDAYRFRLSDDVAAVTLDCDLDPQNADAAPQHCSAARYDTTPLGRFDAVAITRMDGARVDGIPVHLLRISQ